MSPFCLVVPYLSSNTLLRADAHGWLKVRRGCLSAPGAVGGFRLGGFRVLGQTEVEERFKLLGDICIRVAGVEALEHAELEGVFAVLIP